jgi:hypothetical protein
MVLLLDVLQVNALNDHDWVIGLQVGIGTKPSNLSEFFGVHTGCDIVDEHLPTCFAKGQVRRARLRCGPQPFTVRLF